MIDCEDIIEIRACLVKNLLDYDGIFNLSELDIDSELIDRILFRRKVVDGKLIYKTFALPKDANAKIDFMYVNFDGLDGRCIDFSEYNNVHLNPQTIYFKDLRFCKFKGVTFTGNFVDTLICGCNFTGSYGAVINPQNIHDRDLRKTRLCDAIIVGSFEHAKLEGTSFKGSMGASIDLDLCRYNDETNFSDAYVFKSSKKDRDELIDKIKSKLKK